MKLPRRQFVHLAAGAAVLPALTFIAKAQVYPTRPPVRVIIPFAPAGPTDVFGRLMAQKLSDYFGKQFYVENIGGAGGNVGAARVAKLPPDGYALLVTANAFVVNPSLFEKSTL
jgi:tripartite-type tricarboxylate transporter receptor subunit TctC